MAAAIGSLLHEICDKVIREIDRLHHRGNFPASSKHEGEGDRLEKEGDRLEKEGDRLEKEGDGLEKEGDGLEKEGDRLEKEGDRLEKTTVAFPFM